MSLTQIKSLLAFVTITLCATFVSAAPIADTVITTEVKAKLMQEKDIPATAISVTTTNGIVELKGNVDTKLQASRAIEIASEVDGVADVNNDDLKVKESDSLMSDGIITAKVKGKIRYLYMYKKIAEGYDLHVETTNGDVHIFGDVMKSSDTEVVTAAAKKIKGVKNVKTNIKVKN